MNNNKVWYKKILFLSQGNLWEKSLLIVNLTVTIGLLIYQCATGSVGDWKTWIAFVANIFNIISVILATKKHISCFIWGLLAVIGFGGVAFGNQVIGNVILYGIFYIPAQLFALYLGQKHTNDKIQVQPTSIKGGQIILTVILSIGLITLFAGVETTQTDFRQFWLNDTNPKDYSTLTYITDAATLVLSIVMTIYTWCRFKERGYISILVDLCQITLGSTILYKDVSNISAGIMVTSSITMMISAIYGVFNGQK